MAKVKAIPLKCCLWELSKRKLVPPNDRALSRIIEEDQEFTKKLNRYYKDTSELGLDTFEREELLEIVGQKFAKMSWPCNMHGQEYTDQFANNLVTSVKAEGWTISD